MKKESLKIKRALLSVSDKAGIVEFSQALVESGVEIISTGGTKKVLEEAGLKITPIEAVTGNPEAFGGRMKTISFQIGSALLFRRDNSEDIATAKELGITPIDLVVCNLYPFEKYRDVGEKNIETLIENIDIGGPTMIRAAAKNFENVLVLTNPKDYPQVEKELKDGISFETRKKAALKAFSDTFHYDAMISEYLGGLLETPEGEIPRVNFQDSVKLRYGENSHQTANLFKIGSNGIANAKQIQGKELSYNNLLDAEAAWKSCGDASNALPGKTAVSVIKHLNPCGLAVHDNPSKAIEMAWEGDPVSAFGGIIGISTEVSESELDFFKDKFIEVIVAPSFTPGALELARKKKNLRVLVCENYKGENEKVIRSISGGVLVQDEDTGLDPELNLVTENKELDSKKSLSSFGVMACKHLKSNAIALVAERENGFQLVGAGMGQPNRIESLTRLCIPRFEERFGDKGISLGDCLMISDAFFPFSDTIEECAKVGIKNIIQPGGSIRDNEVIDAANNYQISMGFTGRRHFRH